MPPLDTLAKLTSPSGRAHLTLLRADRFAVGRIGSAAQIPRAQRALELLLREQATDRLFDLLERASLPGQLYGLLGLSVIGHARVATLVADYRQRTGAVQTETACFLGSQSISEVVARIEDGTYSGLLQSESKGA